MESRGLTLEDQFRARYNLSREIDVFAFIEEAIMEDQFRARYNLSREIDVFAFIEEAIMVASWEKPEEFKRRRSNIAETLFRNPKSDVEDMGRDDNAGGVASRKSNLITGKDDHACTIVKHCDRSDIDGNKMRKRIIIKVQLPKRGKEVTGEVNKKLDRDMGCDGHADGKASRKSNLTVLNEAVISKDSQCATEKDRARLDDNGHKWGRRVINSPMGREVFTCEVKKKLDQDMGCDGHAHGKASRKSSLTVTTDACGIEKHCARMDDNGDNWGRRAINLPKGRKEFTCEVKKKFDPDMGFVGHADGKASRKSSFTITTDALTSKDRACAIQKNCARLDDNGNKTRGHLIKLSERREEVTTEVNKKLDQTRGCDGHADGKSSRKRPLSTITEALTIKERPCTIEKQCPRSDDNGNKRRRCLINLSESRKEVTNEVKKKLDQDMVKKLDQDMVQTRLESSVRKLESRYQQIGENKRKIQVLGVKDLPPSKSTARCNNIPHRRPFSKRIQCRFGRRFGH